MNARRFAIGAVTLISTAVVVASCGGGSDPEPQPPFAVKIIAINDFHGNLQSPGTFGVSTAVPAADRPAVGGAEFLAAYVAKMKAANPNSVVVGAGDNIGASPLISALFFDEPAVEALNRIGMEFTSVGNHEFDKGSAELLRLQNGGCKVTNGTTDPASCRGATVGTPVPFEGAKFKWLSANVVKTSDGQPLLPAFGTKTFNGVPVAFIGMTLKATPTIVTPTGVAGLEFRDEATTVNALVPTLKAQGIQAIVVLVHEGGFQTGSLSDINGCEGNLAGSAIAEIVKKLDDAVDVVVSGHTHAAYNCKLPNAAGRLIPVTSTPAFGRTVTEIDVTINPETKDITAVTAANRLIARNDPATPATAAVASLVTAYNGLVSPIANQVIGSHTVTLSNSRTDKACNMPAGDLIADAMLDATKAATFGNATIAFMNGGGVRNPGYGFAQTVGEGDGNMTYGEAFTVQPFGNTLVTMTLTQQDLKDVLEEQFAGCKGQGATTTRVMLASAGLKYTWDGSQACNSRIRSVTLSSGGATETIVTNGVLANPTKTYRVTVNNFMATGGDGYSTFLKGTSQLGGAQDIDAFVAYMSNFKAPKAAYAPGARTEDAGSARINRTGGTNCPTGADTNP
ncbi:Endonuclease YhcR [Usitatibacter rugosus]|uniref:Endonuclease YhcR n=1 Tax=Usitatibacter rugosus TaxID=2732067 RepID=A0A6M4GUF0_9PROT|nr:bifunctional metallophosphatase/5'-nucleotidase [Usitatibacter rugosus]QJR10951.1 Endonuclease YhcR [Usitatibacter rugosus]